MRLRQQHNIPHRHVEIQIVTEKISADDGRLAHVPVVACNRLGFRQLHVLGAHRNGDSGALLHALASARLELAERRAHDATLAGDGKHGTGDEICAADEICDEAVARLIVDLSGRADLDHAAFVHHCNLVRERKRLGLIVGNVDGGELEIALQPFELETHAVAQLRVQIGQWLIQQQQLRLHHQRARKRQPLLLAARELGGVAVHEVFERDRLEHPHDLFPDQLLSEPAHLQRERYILKYIHVRPNGVGLEHHAEIALVRRDKNAP